MRPVKRGLPGWLSALLVLMIVGGGIGVAVAFVKTRAEPKKEQEEASLPIVEVVEVVSGREAVKLDLNGQVQASRQVVVMPEVGGRIVWQNRELVPGGMVKAGTTLVRIDPRDYSLAVKQQHAQVASQQLSLKVEERRGDLAGRELELFNKEREAAGLPKLEADDAALALRQPHLKSAKVAVTSARSGLSRAKLQLSKTVIVAPFNAFVRTEAVEKGQLVSPGMQLATLVGTDSFWVQVSVPIDKLRFVRMPEGDKKGSKVRVFVETGSGRIERTGYVIRLLGDLDPVGRLARVLVEIKDPFLLKETSDGAASKRLPLLLGSYVRVEIEGIELKDVLRIPRLAMQENSTVHLLDADNKLTIETVDVIWGSSDMVMVRGPLKKGDRLVVTNLAAPVVGMKVRIAKNEDGSSKEAKVGNK